MNKNYLGTIFFIKIKFYFIFTVVFIDPFFCRKGTPALKPGCFYICSGSYGKVFHCLILADISEHKQVTITLNLFQHPRAKLWIYLQSQRTRPLIKSANIARAQLQHTLPSSAKLTKIIRRFFRAGKLFLT